MIKPQTLKGFRDFLPKEAKKRQYVINTLKQVFESYGFEPLETPALEYEEVLLGKYGEEGDKLMYRFTDLGGRKVALRYDQTVPLARVVAQYGNELPMPFKRYQVQPVWRAENTQKGRFREFLQCDADIVGTSSPLADVEILSVVNSALKKLGFEKYKIKFNSRKILFQKIKDAGVPNDLTIPTIRTIDKIEKIGWQEVEKELIKAGVSKKNASSLKDLLSTTQPQEDMRMNEIWESCSIRNIKLDWTLTLARGLDYYTDLIFEIEIEGYSGGSVCGGGRYDNLIGMFAGKDIPAVGFAFGFDRLMEAMDQLNLFPEEVNESTTKVLVTIFPASPDSPRGEAGGGQGGSPELKEKSLALTTALHSAGVQTELYLNESSPLKKQLKYADQKGIPYCIIIGPDEVKNQTVTIKNMKTREQKTVSLDVIPNLFRDLDY